MRRHGPPTWRAPPPRREGEEGEGYGTGEGDLPGALHAEARATGAFPGEEDIPRSHPKFNRVDLEPDLVLIGRQTGEV